MPETELLGVESDHSAREPKDRLNSVEAVSRRLSVSTFTVRRLIKRGDLRAVYVSKRLLVAESEIERVIRDGCGKRAGRIA
jgi:predicted site-specific integrase-resolvase